MRLLVAALSRCQASQGTLRRRQEAPSNRQPG